MVFKLPSRAAAAALLISACTKQPPTCEPHQVYNAAARSCAVRCGTREAPAHPECYDTDSGMIVSTASDASDAQSDAANRVDAFTLPLDDASTDTSHALDGSRDASGPPTLIEDPTVETPRATSPLSTAIVTSQRPTLRWVSTAAIDGAVVEVSRTRDFTTIEQRQRVG